MNATQANAALAWAQEHDWGRDARIAFFDARDVPGGHAILVPLSEDDADDAPCYGGHVEPDEVARGYKFMPPHAVFYTIRRLMFWAGY